MGFLKDLGQGFSNALSGAVNAVTGIAGGVLGAATSTVSGVLGAANPLLQTVGSSPTLTAALGAAVGLPPTAMAGIASAGSGAGIRTVPSGRITEQKWFYPAVIIASVLSIGGLLYVLFKPKRRKY